jgi:hypothetical protein
MPREKLRTFYFEIAGQPAWPAEARLHGLSEAEQRAAEISTREAQRRQAPCPVDVRNSNIMRVLTVRARYVAVTRTARRRGAMPG